MNKLLVSAIALFLSISGVPTTAQEVVDDPPDDTGEPRICVMPLTLWKPSPETTARIRVEPVPEEFVRKFESRPCNTLHKPALLDWHFAFGDEETTAAALAYYASQWTPEAIDPEEYSAALERAWELARPRYERADELRALTSQNEALEFYVRDGRILQLRRILAIGEVHETMLVYYLRAAEFFDSPRLLDRAEALLPVVESRNAFFDRHAAVFEAGGPYSPNDPREVDNRSWSLMLPYSLAVARYRIKGIDFDAASVRALAVGPYEQAIAEAADLAWRNEGEYDIDKTTLKALKIADQSEDNFVRYAVRILREDLLLGFAMAERNQASRCDIDNFHETLILLQEFEQYGRDEGMPLGFGTSYWPQDHREQRLELLLAKADCERAKAEHRADGRDGYSNPGTFYSAFETLDQARQLVQPDESPAQFRRIAQRYLDLAQLCRSNTPEPNPAQSLEGCRVIIDRRLESYFRVNLDALDTIATAANAPR